MTVMQYLDAAKESIFRFEYLQEYKVSSEKEYLDAYIQTGSINTELLKEWWKFLEDLHARQVHTERVRLIREPVNIYTEWELLLHKESLAHGDQISIFREKNLTSNLEVLGDFWLIDSATALSLKYSPGGVYLGFEIDQDLEKYLSAKKYLLSHSEYLC